MNPAAAGLAIALAFVLGAILGAGGLVMFF